MNAVRLGNSGLKVSKIILGMMSYGSKGWQGWVLEEEDAVKHVKAAYVHDLREIVSSEFTKSYMLCPQLRCRYSDIRHRRRLLEWSLGSHTRKHHQETQPTS